MKFSKLSMGVAAASGLALLSSNALATGGTWDTSKSTFEGNSPFQYHNISYALTPAVCAAGCIAVNAEGQESHLQLVVTNKDGAFFPGSATNLDTLTKPVPADGQVYQSTNVGGADPLNTFDASGNQLTASLINIETWAVYNPAVQCQDVNPAFGLGGCNSAATGAVFVELGGAFNVEAYNFNTDANGRIREGYLVASVLFAGTPFNVFVDWSADGLVDTGANLGPLSDFITAVDNGTLRNDPAGCDGGGCGGLLPSAGYSTTDIANYATVGGDEAALAKAVPVPAFAAAALGLGLLGVTYATRRKGKIA